ncbi:hypothetical protein FRC05_011009 [Tulasnella sp. 425]|nr:hypothetical protein FRC05_011009 [Tulasnella sp. 425]
MPRFGEEYGPLTWLTIPGQNLLIINSFEAAKELLEKRALVFIDRPRFVMLRELLDLGNYLAFSAYNETWRKQRAHLKVPLSASVIKRDYSPLLEVKAREYLERCFVRPENFLTEINRCLQNIAVIVAETNIKLTYGRLEDEQGLDYIQINAHILEFIAQGLQGYVVDLFPALQYLPAWLPGMKFKRDAARWKQEISDLEHVVSKSAKGSMLSDDPEVRPSFMFKKLQEFQEKYEEGMDVQQQMEDEMVITRSGLSLFLGKYFSRLIHDILLICSRN